jgi:regulatory protein
VPDRTKNLSPTEALAKLQKFCAYQERCHQEVRDKLYSLGLHQSDVEDILTQLITSGFLNEERFAKAFAGGKFRMKHWGRNKIVHELKLRDISKRCIQAGLNEIDEDDYHNSLMSEIEKKMKIVSEANVFKRRDKVARYVIGKGYEPELVWKELLELIPE